MKFSEIKERMRVKDEQALSDWNARAGDCYRRPPSLEDHISFIEFRRLQLAATVIAILDELIEQENKHNVPPKLGE